MMETDKENWLPKPIINIYEKSQSVESHWSILYLPFRHYVMILCNKSLVLNKEGISIYDLRKGVIKNPKILLVNQKKKKILSAGFSLDEWVEMHLILLCLHYKFDSHSQWKLYLKDSSI